MDAKKQTESQEIRDRKNYRKKFSGNKNGIKNDIVIQLKRNIYSTDKQDYKVLRNGEAKKEIERLEIENVCLKQLIANMKAENTRLRTCLGISADLYWETKSNLK